MREHSDAGFKINNCATAGLARLAMEVSPRLQGFFEIRAVEYWSERDAGKYCSGSRKMARHGKRRAAALDSVGASARAVIPVLESRVADTSAENI